MQKDKLIFKQKVWPNGMLSENWTITKENGDDLLCMIPNATLVFDYDPTFDGLTITCNQFVEKRLNEIIDQAKEAIGNIHINCIKNYKGQKQISLRLRDMGQTLPSLLALLKRGQKVEVVFHVKGISYARHQHYLTLALKDIKLI